MGICTRTVVPALGALEKAISPCNRLVRSEMPSKPKWPSRGPAQSSKANPFPVILDLQDHVLGAVIQFNFRQRRAGMFDDIGQRLLGDAQQILLHRFGQGRTRPCGPSFRRAGSNRR
jgi:hypothetical protein